jgi:hypothetical protein
LSEQTRTIGPGPEELNDEQLEGVSGGFIIQVRFAQLPAVQSSASSVLLGGPDTTPIGTQS